MRPLALKTHYLLFGLAFCALPFNCGCRQQLPPQQTGPDNTRELRNQAPDASFAVRIPWAETGQWLKVDTHTHTKFSDGAFPVLAVVQAAIENGCEAIGITDHAIRNMQTASPEYFAQIRRARETFPEIVIIAGLEWNIPSYGGLEHVNILAAPGQEQRLTEFKQRFDDYDPPDDVRPDVIEALAWIDANLPSAVLMLNHPSRKRTEAQSIWDDLVAWRAQSSAIVGISGAPGHQMQDPVGSYRGPLKPIDRWDPATDVGGQWDQLLAGGSSIWAALAPSDFHSEENGDYWPGQFSETWVFAPDHSPEGILNALRAGCFFANHGGIARQVTLNVHHHDLDRPAVAGETITVKKGPVDLSVSMSIPTHDLLGSPNRIDQIELIGITEQDCTILATKPPTGSDTWLLKQWDVPTKGVTLRLRGRRINEHGPDLMFVTNPIRINVHIPDSHSTATERPRKGDASNQTLPERNPAESN